VDLAVRQAVSLLRLSSLDADFAITPPGILIAYLRWKPGDTTPLFIFQR
jgi:hypothetical protein